MSMLAEPRRKTFYSPNPRGKAWSEDVNSFGRRMLEKMGWSQGKGLGVNESGRTDIIHVSQKVNNKGLGFSGLDAEDAVSQQKEFDALLATLSQGADGQGKGESSKPPEMAKGTPKSLELMSQKSRARVHYHKFTRGKDLSRASSKDLASILGKPLDTKPAPPPVEVAVGPTIGGTTSIVAQENLHQYFKQKLSERKRKSASGDVNDVDEKSVFSAEAVVEHPVEKKKKKKSKNKDVDSVNDSVLIDSPALNETVQNDSNGSVSKGRRKSVTWGDVEVSFVSKYIKDMVDSSSDSSNSDGSNDVSNETENIQENSGAVTNKKKKEKKKKQDMVDSSSDSSNSDGSNDVSNETENIQENSGAVTNKKKKEKKKKKEDMVDSSGDSTTSESSSILSNEMENIEENSVVVPNKRKKDKKKRKEDSGQVVESHLDHPSETSFEYSEENARKKKNKKSKEKNAAEEENIQNCNQSFTETTSNLEILDISQNKKKKKKKLGDESTDIHHFQISEISKKEVTENNAPLKEAKKKKRKDCERNLSYEEEGKKSDNEVVANEDVSSQNHKEALDASTTEINKHHKKKRKRSELDEEMEIVVGDSQSDGLGGKKSKKKKVSENCAEEVVTEISVKKDFISLSHIGHEVEDSKFIESKKKKKKVDKSASTEEDIISSISENESQPTLSALTQERMSKWKARNKSEENGKNMEDTEIKKIKARELTYDPNHVTIDYDHRRVLAALGYNVKKKTLNKAVTIEMPPTNFNGSNLDSIPGYGQCLKSC